MISGRSVDVGFQDKVFIILITFSLAVLSVRTVTNPGFLEELFDSFQGIFEEKLPEVCRPVISGNNDITILISN